MSLGHVGKLPNWISCIMFFAISSFALLVWLYLLVARGDFWRPRLRLDGRTTNLARWPSVAVIVPARNEADVVDQTVAALLAIDYPGPLNIGLIDDASDDGTADVAERAAQTALRSQKIDPARPQPSFEVVAGSPLPAGWAGKVWAMKCGVDHLRRHAPEYFLFCDADIAHDPSALRRLVDKAVTDDLDLVSQMVMLSVRGRWEALLIPAFVFFFAKLYPFAWVNRHPRKLAAAAGGCMLVRRKALEAAGGLTQIRSQIIDDCALARLIKGRGRVDGGHIWLGWTKLSRSVRPYGGLSGVWHMVARTAYTQLRHSPVLLALTVLAMVLVYLAGPLLALAVPMHQQVLPAVLGGSAYLIAAAMFVPDLRLYGQNPWLGLLLPVAGVLYTGMTIWSAVTYYRGRGGAWKGRFLAGPEAVTERS